MSANSRDDFINRCASPMKIVEENASKNALELANTNKEIAAVQNLRSPMLIGSIDDINKRISQLDCKLQSYTDLIIDSQASDFIDDVPSTIRPSSSKLREQYQKKERESKEVKCFAGIYAIRSTFGPTLAEKDKYAAPSIVGGRVVATDSSKPKLVELHQYPGYDSAGLTPLPHGVKALEILAKVVDAQPRLRKTPQYRPEFERLFYSEMSQAILQDLFWWIFLEQYQKALHYQVKLFNRIAHNYVKLIGYIKHIEFREPFLNDYPNLLCQAIYSTFCWSFPNSYRMFGEDFKESIVTITYTWITGVCPAPRSWLKWTLQSLEPAGLKNRDDAGKNGQRVHSSLNLDYLDMLPSHFPGGGESESSVFRASSTSSLTSQLGSRRNRPKPKIWSTNGSKKRKTSTSSSQSSSSAELVNSRENEDKHAESMKHRDHTTRRDGSRRTKRWLHSDSRDTATHDALTPIREYEESYDPTVIAGSPNLPYEKSYASIMKAWRRQKTESHPCGRGPDFVRNVFDIYSLSPLVAHFMRMKQLQPDAGKQYLVQRTHMENLPPLDAPTYKDLIRDTFRQIRTSSEAYNKLLDNNKHDQIQLKHRQKKLLERQFNMRNSSVSSSLTGAIHATMMAQE